MTAECECFWLPEHMWLSAASCGYGSGYEPGSQQEWNPDCPAHPGTADEALTPEEAKAIADAGYDPTAILAFLFGEADG